MLKIINIFVVSIIVLSCGTNSKNDCTSDIKFPSSKFSYPNNITTEDTGFIYVSYKDSLNSVDSFHFAFSGYHFLRSFDENNLSLKPSGKILVRISYESWGDTPFVLKMSCNEITLKVFESGSVYPIEDTLSLNEIEKIHYKILEKYFPLDSIHYIPERKVKYIDSLKNLYPELLSAKYYRQLKEKAIMHEKFKMKYKVYRKSITFDKFKYFVDKINRDKFWELPHRMNIDEPVADGGGYFLEVHTMDHFRLITSSNCPDISDKLTKTCQEIIDLVKPVDKSLKLCN